MTSTMQRIGSTVLAALHFGRPRARRAPHLDYRHFSDRELADLNLPSDIRNRIEQDRANLRRIYL